MCSEMSTGLYAKYRYCCQIVMKLLLSRQIFEICSNIKVNENSSRGVELFCADEETERQT
jgi:hypothetical protein